ncbi:lysoplasmalogenase [Nocardioides sp. KR10-350]|uniref:lysoplasmalogenase n=1 Tax=Nocardioides cheoyonin TaxID=3156615 RepID=UPI0032B36FE3
MPVVLLGVLTALDALTDWAAVVHDRRRAEHVTKPLVMVGLMAITVAAGGTGSAAGWWLLAALFFGMLGDIALLGDSEPRFLSGVAAFLVGHVGYVVCFALLGLPSPAWAWVVIVVLVAMLVVTRRVVPTAYRLAGARIAVPIALYSLVIGIMLVLAWLTGLPLVAAGATIFVVSDAMIALTLAETEFGRPHGAVQLAIMVTYHVGQALVAAGVLHAL